MSLQKFKTSMKKFLSLIAFCLGFLAFGSVSYASPGEHNCTKTDCYSVTVPVSFVDATAIEIATCTNLFYFDTSPGISYQLNTTTTEFAPLTAILEPDLVAGLNSCRYFITNTNKYSNPYASPMHFKTSHWYNT